jgi:hypothetical protein
VMNFITEEEETTGQSAFYARQDAGRRAEAAYAAHKGFFESQAHLDSYNLALVVARGRVKNCKEEIITERVRKGRPCTQIKFNKAEFNSGQRVLLEDALEAYGFDRADFGYYPKSQSFSIFVY